MRLTSHHDKNQAQAVITCFGIGTNLRPVLGPVNAQHDASASTETMRSHRGDNEEVRLFMISGAENHTYLGNTDACLLNAIFRMSLV